MVTTGRWVLLAFSGWTAPQTENEMASNNSSAKGGDLVLRTSHHLGIPGKFFGLGFFFFSLFPATLHSIWDLSSPTRDQTHAPVVEA